MLKKNQAPLRIKLMRQLKVLGLGVDLDLNNVAKFLPSLDIRFLLQMHIHL